MVAMNCAFGALGGDIKCTFSAPDTINCLSGAPGNYEVYIWRSWKSMYLGTMNCASDAPENKELCTSNISKTNYRIYYDYNSSGWEP
jgi:hypothetical protein